jgi:RimJ/RimL family protein N-acetyltransferase
MKRLPIPELLNAGPVRLRPFRIDDLPAFQAFMTNAEATRYLVFSDAQKTAEGALELLNEVVSGYQAEEPMFVLAIADVSSDALLGACGLSPLGPNVDDEAECFYALHPSHWGQGLATHAARALLIYAFDVLKLRRVVAFTSPANPASHRVAEKAGMIGEGEATHPLSGLPGLRFAIEA